MPRVSTSSIPKHVFHHAIERVPPPPSTLGRFNLLPFKQLCANDFHPDYHTKPVPRAESQGSTKTVVSVQPPYPPPIMPPSGGNLMILGGEDMPKRRVAKACQSKTRARASPVAVKKSTKRNMSTARSRSTRSKTKHPPKSLQHNDAQAPIPKSLLYLPHQYTQPPAPMAYSLLPPCSSIMLGLCGAVPPDGHPFPAAPMEVDSAWNTIQAHKVIDDFTISTVSMPCTERLPSFKEKFGELGRPDSARYPIPRPTLPPLRCPGPELLDLLRGRKLYWREESSSSSSSLSDEEALDGSGCGSSSDSTSAGGSAYSPSTQEAYPYPYAGTLGGYGEDVGMSSVDVPPRACIGRPVWSWGVNEWQTWA
ncbi:hypothetical protein D9611_014351 [Ephemerocybe angulata]|uniref:Uncharacterized protein n=1 Tax=Ephemerocybe angulata TaxID=980116 RepID=A0A8H5EZQ4_9AGAR|nr:hypothetical protein D9611_014351 [Tulosesus angulatus]